VDMLLVKPFIKKALSLTTIYFTNLLEYLQIGLGKNRQKPS